MKELRLTKCKDCEGTVSVNAVTCPHCGAILKTTEPRLKKCKDCNGTVSINANKCPHCGAKFKTTTADHLFQLQALTHLTEK